LFIFSRSKVPLTDKCNFQTKIAIWLIELVNALFWILLQSVLIKMDFPIQVHNLLKYN